MTQPTREPRGPVPLDTPQPTPGPWTVAKSPSGTLWVMSGHTWLFETSRLPNADANANLAAHALAMREALEAICDGACWSLSGGNRHIAGIDSKKIECARAILRAIEGAV